MDFQIHIIKLVFALILQLNKPKELTNVPTLSTDENSILIYAKLHIKIPRTENTYFRIIFHEMK